MGNPCNFVLVFQSKTELDNPDPNTPNLDY